MSIEFWDTRYSEEGMVYGEAPNDFLASVVDRLPRGTALCLAEGEGRNAMFLAERGWDVTAMDQSRVGMEKARAWAERRKLKVGTVVADLANYDLGVASVDVVVATWMHLPPPLRASVHAGVVRALRPGGAVVIEAYTPAQLQYKTGGPPDVALLQTLEMLRTDLVGLKVEHGVEIVREVHEGKYHGGASAVVQVLAFKH